jgi:hypothetical protein
VSFFESGGTEARRPRRDDSWRYSDDAFSRLRREHRRRRTVIVSSVVGALALALFGLVAVIGPETIATSAHRLLAGDVAPPAAEVVAVADKSYLTEEGRALLYSSRPRIVASADVAEACDRRADDPPSGCYSLLDGIVLHQPSDPRVADFAVTTMAHELLHAAYDRLGDGEMLVLHDLLEAEIARIPADDPVHASIEWSVGEHEASRETELFAYLGSQVRPEGGFAPELEAVYARYFTDRAALVGVYERVGGFLDAVSAELTAAYDQLSADAQAQAAERSRLDADRAAHESARTQYNADADRYNQLPAEERGRWMATWTDPDGTPRSAPLGESLAERLAELEAHRAELDARTAALSEAASSLEARTAGVEAQRLDVIALLEAAYPGQSFG